MKLKVKLDFKSSLVWEHIRGSDKGHGLKVKYCVLEKVADK